MSLFVIDGFWKNDESEFNGYLVNEYDDCPENMSDDDIFYFGLGETEIKAAIEEGINTNLEFVITNYSSFSKENLAKILWNKLGDVPVTADDDLDEDFVINEMETTFKKGTDKLEVWHWFEETFNISVAKDLMGLE